jgi:hypothetical protein
MWWLMRHLQAYRGRGWFAMGVRYPVPETWQGWLALLLFLIALLATLPLDGSEAAWPVRMAVLGLFGAVVFWTLERGSLE